MQILALFLALFIAALPVAARADDAAALLAKHKAYVGWQFGDGTFSSMVINGKMTFQKDGSTKTAYMLHGVRLGLASRFTMTGSNGTTEDSGFTGNIFWATNRNGFTYPRLGDTQKFGIAEGIVFNELASGLDGKSRGTKVLDGKEYAVVRVALPQSDAVDLYIDPSTGAYKQATIAPGAPDESTLHILGYTEPLPGKKVISKYAWDSSRYTTEYTTIVPNASVDPQKLHPPQQTAQWTFASGKPFRIEYKDGDRQRGIYLDATVNGVPGHFLLDTGAAEIVLDSGFAGRAHFKELRKSTSWGIGGSKKTRVGRVDSITIGGNTLSNVLVTADDMNWKGVDGLIGFDLFAGAVVRLDLDGGTMTLYDPQSWSDSSAPKGIPFLIDLSNNVPMIPMTVNKSIPVNGLLDSGDLANITFSYALMTKSHLAMLIDPSLEGIFTAHAFVSGVGGNEVEECGRLDSVLVGPITFGDPKACYSRSWGQYASDNQMLVGFDFLKHFNILFDYPHAKLTLTPRDENN